MSKLEQLPSLQQHYSANRVKINFFLWKMAKAIAVILIPMALVILNSRLSGSNAFFSSQITSETFGFTAKLDEMVEMFGEAQGAADALSEEIEEAKEQSQSDEEQKEDEEEVEREEETAHQGSEGGEGETDDTAGAEGGSIHLNEN